MMTTAVPSDGTAESYVLLVGFHIAWNTHALQSNAKLSCCHLTTLNSVDQKLDLSKEISYSGKVPKKPYNKG